MVHGFLVFVLGLVFGSFISAFSYRFPRGISIVRGRSFCPRCNKQIKFYDNIPLLSYFLLGGKCRNCKKPISWRYPALELITALGFLLIYLHFFPNYVSTIYYLTIFVILVLIFIIDLEHRIIPDTFVFLGVFLVLIYLVIVPSLHSLLPSLFSGFLAASSLMLLHLITLGRGMGLGDVKFAVFGGMLIGINLFLIWLFLSFLTGGIVGIILILARRAGLKSQVAFGPFLVAGMILTIFCSRAVLGFFGF